MEGLPMDPLAIKPHTKSQRGLMCAAWIGVSLLALNTLLLGALVTGLVLTSVKVQPLLSSVNADDIRRLSAAIGAADETDLVRNVGSVMKTVSQVHLLPSSLTKTAVALLGFDVANFADSVNGITSPALQAIKGLEFAGSSEANDYAHVATYLYVTSTIAKMLGSWQRVNDAPDPDLGILDVILGSGEAGSGVSWLRQQVNATELKAVSASCTAVHKQLLTTNFPGISWKDFTSSNE